jgi:hypothetical protein
MHMATTFEDGGKVYEVRAIPTLNIWKVRIFKHLEGPYFRRRHPGKYSVDSEVNLRHARSFRNMQSGNRMRRQRR